MGQLERYGLYVLCIVIFLILGVALWGGDPIAPAGNGTLASAVSRELRSPSPTSDRTEGPSAPRDGGTERGSLEKEEDTVARLRQAFGSATETAKPEEKSVEPLAGVTSVPASDPGSAAPAPRAATTSEYVIKKNDKLETIALEHLGKRTAWPEIVKLNPGLSPTRLVAGEKIKLPARSAASAPARLADDEYEIKHDDTLEDIALTKLGKKSRWREIAAANPGLNPALLKPGSRIKIPRGPAVANAKR